jgi:hypothetical protein
MGNGTKITGFVLMALACAAVDKGDRQPLLPAQIGAMGTRHRGEKGVCPLCSKPEIVWVEKVWSSAPHNAFTDLVRYKERWFCALREGQAQRSPDGAIRILTSLDGEVWKSAARIASPEGDLRYPKLSASTDGRLMLVAVAERQGVVWERHQSLLWLSPDGRTWGAPMSVCEPNVQLGRLAWHNRMAFGAGYGNVREEFLRIYAAHQPDKFVALTPKILTGQAPGEASLLFLEDGSALCLAQRDAQSTTAALGRAKPPYRGWTWTGLNVNLESPNMLMLPDSRIVAAGRVTSGGKSRIALLWLDPEDDQLREFLALPSGGEAGYPGLAWHDGLLWVSYHSSHDGKTGIYVAKVRTGDK